MTRPYVDFCVTVLIWSNRRPGAELAADGLAATRIGIGLSRVVPHAPVLPFGQGGFVGMSAPSVFDIASVVGIAHQCAPVPTDLACDFGSASHCFCTSRSACVGISPDGA